MLRRLHMWIGLAVALFVLVQAVTGTLLLAKAPLLVNEHPSLRRDDRTPTPLPDAVAKVAETMGEGVWSFIRFPAQDAPLIEVGLKTGSRVLFDRHGNGPLASGFAGHPSVVHWLHDLHVHLAAGEVGENIAGVSGVALLFLGISGLVVWWPFRKRTEAKNLVPRGSSRPKLLRWHWTTGFVFSIVIVGLAFSGVEMSFHGVIQRPLLALAGEDYGASIMRGLPPLTASSNAKPDWRAIIIAADAVFPDDTLGLISAPRTPDGYVMLRTHRADEWNPVGRSLIAVDPNTSTVVASWSAHEAGAVGQAFMALYPLHAGKVGGVAYVLLIMFSGLAIIALTISGVMAYVKRPKPATEPVLKPDPKTA